MKKRCIDKVKKDILKLLTKYKCYNPRAIIDEEKYNVFLNQLYDTSVKKIGPLNTSESYYLRRVCNVIEDTSFYREAAYEQAGITFNSRSKDVFLWIIQTKLAYCLRKNSNIGIARKDRNKPILLSELEISGTLSSYLHARLIQTVDQLIEYSIEEIYEMFSKTTGRVLPKFMLYELYEIVRNLGYGFKGETVPMPITLDKENEKELVEKDITEVMFESIIYSEKVTSFLHNQGIYTIADLVSLTTEEVIASGMGKRMYNCIFRTIHNMMLVFKDEVFVYIENPYFNQIDSKAEISQRKDKLEFLMDIYKAKQERVKEIREDSEELNKEIQALLALITEEKKQIEMLVKKDVIVK